jgi:hypothetical protein
VVSFSHVKQTHHRQNTAHRIGKTRPKFVNAKHLHARRLQPNKKRWFFPKGFKVQLHLGVIARYQHLARTFGKVHLVPVEQGTLTNKGDEE